MLQGAIIAFLVGIAIGTLAAIIHALMSGS